MATSIGWCTVCRGDAESHDDLIKCSGCKSRYHLNCAGLRCWPDDLKEWRCDTCVMGANQHQKSSAHQQRIRAVRAVHKQLKSRSAGFYEQSKAALAPFIAAEALAKLTSGGEAVLAQSQPLTIGPHEPYITATLRAYQCEGVNWLLKQYSLGTGGILGDEMGLGKTIQTLAFLSKLKAAGLPGPHLVVTPLAVLQNWANELKRFTPQLSFVKVHGGASERDRLLTSPAVLQAEYDVYLTTYDTLRAEEAFFTEAFLFHTITIDEGHRLKNEASSLCASLARLPIPFRLLLTGTPLQNNLHELWALLSYILPGTLSSESFDGAASVGLDDGQMDRSAVAQARSLLECVMMRRVKSQVETSLLPKIEYVLKPPLMPLQRAWYRKLLGEAKSKVSPDGGEEGGGGGSLLSAAQLQSRLMQLQKVCNHPKAIALTIDRDRAAAAAMHAAAAGSSFIKLPPRDNSHLSAEAREDEALLRGLTGEGLVTSSGKMAMLDRLLVRCRAAGSRVLIFSQYTLSLDVLEEYATFRWGALGSGYFRLDGTTNRIAREMDMRSFNAPGAAAFLYLISTRAGGQGINLATADVVVLYDTCYNPQVDLQAQDRAHRIGQTKQVKIYRLISPSTFEERVLLRARQKLLLDALVIKKAGEAGAGVAMLEAEAAEGEEAGDLGKLSVQELYRMLSHGAEAVFDPTADLRPPPTAEEYDAMIDAAKPANVHADLEEAGAEAAEEEDAEGGAEVWEEALLGGSHPRPRGRTRNDDDGEQMAWDTHRGEWRSFGQEQRQAAGASSSGVRAGKGSRADASTAIDSLRLYTCPKVNGLYGSRVHLMSDPTALYEIYGERAKAVATSLSHPCKCQSCCDFVNAIHDELEVRGVAKNSTGHYGPGIKSREELVNFCVLVDDAKTLHLEDGTSLLDLFMNGAPAGTQRASKARLAKECAKRGLQADISGDSFGYFRTLVSGMRAQEAASAAGSNESVGPVADAAAADAAANGLGDRGEGAEADDREEQWEPPPTTRSHDELLSEFNDHMATHGLRQCDLAKRMGIGSAKVSEWVRGAGFYGTTPSRVAALDARAAAYLADPEGVSARFVDPDGVGAWRPLPTTRDHAELVSDMQVHLIAKRMRQWQLALRVGVSISTLSQWLKGKLKHGPQCTMDARAAAYLADPEGVSERCSADTERRAAAADDRRRESEVRASREVEAKAVGGERMRKRKASAPARFSPPRMTNESKAPRATLQHDDFCFNCGDGGELLQCTVCPRTYHVACLGLAEVPKGTWHCPWHACWECQRKSSNVGGQLFHCMTCPLTYCFDCAPDAYTEGNAVRTSAAAATAAMLERRGVHSTRSYLFFHCDDCKTEGRKPVEPKKAPPPPKPPQQSQCSHSQQPLQQPQPSQPATFAELTEPANTLSLPTQPSQPTPQPSQPPPQTAQPPPSPSHQATESTDDSISHIELVKAILALKAKTRINQTEIATRMGVSNSHLSQWVNGKLPSDKSVTSMDKKAATFLKQGGPRVSPPPPPIGWAWPVEGQEIEVEVTYGEHTIWCAANIFTVLVDGWFAARIVLPDDSDEWEDWFTWQEEGTDWRRLAGSAMAPAKAVPAPEPTAMQPQTNSPEVERVQTPPAFSSALQPSVQTAVPIPSVTAATLHLPVEAAVPIPSAVASSPPGRGVSWMPSLGSIDGLNQPQIGRPPKDPKRATLTRTYLPNGQNGQHGQLEQSAHLTVDAPAVPKVVKTEAACPELGDGWRVVSVCRTKDVAGQPVARVAKHYINRDGKRFDTLKKARATMEAGASANGNGPGSGTGIASHWLPSTSTNGMGATAIATGPSMAAATDAVHDAVHVTKAARRGSGPGEATTASATPAASARMEGSQGHSYVGALVKGRYQATSMGTFGTKWFPATVRQVRSDGTYDLVYDDGDVEESVKPEFVRPRAAAASSVAPSVTAPPPPCLV